MDLDIRTQLDPICLQIVQFSQFVLFFSIFRHDPVELKMGCSRAQNLQAMQRGTLAIGQTGKAFWVTFLLSIFGRQFLLSIFGWPFFWAFFVWRFLLSLFGWRLGDAFGWSLLCVISPCLPLWWPVVSLVDNMFMNDHHYDDDNDNDNHDDDDVDEDDIATWRGEGKTLTKRCEGSPSRSPPPPLSSLLLCHLRHHHDDHHHHQVKRPKGPKVGPKVCRLEVGARSAPRLLVT